MPITVAILAFGTLGDVVPYFALGRGFLANGDRVRVATHARFAPLGRAHGFEVEAIDDDPEALLRTPSGRAWLASGANPLRFGLALRRILESRIAPYMQRAHAVCEGADAVIASGLATFIAGDVATRHGIAMFPAFLQPVTSSAIVPNAFASAGRDGPIANRLGHLLHWHGAWRLLRRDVNRARHRVLGLSPLGAIRPFGLDPQRTPILYGFSPSVVPPDPAWPAHVHVTGYWFLDDPAPPRPPPELVSFLARHPDAVSIGFGSMTDPAPEATEALLLDAVAQIGMPAVLLSGWSGRDEATASPRVLRLRSAPHGWLFPRVRAVVHHGGAGTCAAALLAGTPQVVVPHFGDQNFWATRLHKCGVAPPPLPRRRLTAAALATALNAAATRAEYRTAARGLAARIALEDGIGAAVRAVHHHLTEGPR